MKWIKYVFLVLLIQIFFMLGFKLADKITETNATSTNQNISRIDSLKTEKLELENELLKKEIEFLNERGD